MRSKRPRLASNGSVHFIQAVKRRWAWGGCHQGMVRADQQLLVDNIRQLVDPLVVIKIVLKDDIPNTAAGKFR